jgi:NAD(P)H-flavin reductase
MAGTALRGRLTWQLAELVEVVVETPRVKTILFDVPGWAGHRAGQHVDVRLTAEDGYQAERSYSIASAPDSTRVALTVQRLEDGEVSPYLTDELLAILLLRITAVEVGEQPEGAHLEAHQHSHRGESDHDT